MRASRLPPFGKQFADARARGLVPKMRGLGHLVVVLDWDDPCASIPRIVIPPGADPAQFTLTFVAGLHVTINYADRHAARVLDVVDALLAAGAARVDAVNREALARSADLDAAWPSFAGRGVRHAA